MAKMKITKEELEHLYLDKGMTQVEIGKLYSVDRKNIDYYLKKFNIPKRSKSEALSNYYNSKREHKLNERELRLLIDYGWLIGDIAKHFGVSRSTLRAYMDKLGLPSFQNHEAQVKKQSEFMKENNPVPIGAKRPLYVIKAMHEGRKRKVNSVRRNISTFKQYSKIARNIAYSFYKGKKGIPDGFEIDHIFSIKDGWENNIPVEVISHPKNLRLVTPQENRAKGANSLITLEQFYNLIK